jgi:hypothetical protein
LLVKKNLILVKCQLVMVIKNLVSYKRRLNKYTVWRKRHLSLQATGLLNFTDRILAISDNLKELDNVSE